jgi:hypothetical protein
MVPGVEDPRIVGICLSGGGIRSAAFSLGAIQALQIQLGLLNGPHRAGFMSAVSGGSYTAAAYCLAAGGVLDTPSIRINHPDVRREAEAMATDRTADGRPLGPDGHPLWTIDDRDNLTTLWWPFRVFIDVFRMYRDAFRGQPRLTRRFEEKLLNQLVGSGWKSESASDALMPGTPESEYIRNHARYMAEPSGMLATSVQIIFLVLLSMTMVVGSVTILGAVFGALNRFVGLQEFNSNQHQFSQPPSDHGGHSLWLHHQAPWLIVVLAYFAFLTYSRYEARRTLLRRKLAVELTPLDITTRGMALLGFFLVVLFVMCQFAPELLYKVRLHPVSDSHLLTLFITGAASLGSAGCASPALIAVLRSRAIAMPAALAKRSTRLADFGKALAYRLLQLIVAISLPLALLLAFMGGWLLTATNDASLFVLPTLLIWGGEILFFGWLFGGYHNMTPFNFYRNKLSRCFNLIRQSKDGSEAHRARQRVETPALFTLRDADVPELLICASANLSEEGTAPAGALARPIVFSPSTVYMPNIYGAAFDTKTLDSAIRAKYRAKRPLASVYDGSVMTCVAITGAAISPSMGKFTRSWLRALMGFLNMRLGIWMPNPASPDVREAVNETHVAPRVLPSTRYFIRELRGRHFLNSDLIYVSDGGHYENLGLVELVRRGCQEIWCIDGSGDQPGTAVSLAESLTLITSELGLASIHRRAGLSGVGIS